MLVRSNIAGVGRTALTLAINVAMGMRSNVVGIGRTALALAINVAVGMGIVAAAENEGKHNDENNYSCSNTRDNGDLLFAERLLLCRSLFLFLNGSHFGLLIEVLVFFAHFNFSFVIKCRVCTPPVIIT